MNLNKGIDRRGITLKKKKKKLRIPVIFSVTIFLRT